MYRSFTDRVLGGVCGGISETLHIGAWLTRTLFVIMTAASSGYALLVYLVLWWLIPQQLPTIHKRRSIFGLLLVVLVVILMGALWVGRDTALLRSANGESLFAAASLLMVSIVFFIRQVRV